MFVMTYFYRTERIDITALVYPFADGSSYYKTHDHYWELSLIPHRFQFKFHLATIARNVKILPTKSCRGQKTHNKDKSGDVFPEIHKSKRRAIHHPTSFFIRH